MSKFNDDPAEFVAGFLTSFTDEIMRTEGDAGPVVDRYYTPDCVQVADGVAIDRDRMIAHMRPIRKNLVDSRFEVHEAVADGDRVAARLTIHSTMRKRALATEVHLFAEFAPDGRMRGAHQLTRTLPGDD